MYIYFDIDKSSSVLGSPEDIKKMLGSKPERLIEKYKDKDGNKGIDYMFRDYVGRYFKAEKVTAMHEILGIETEEIIVKPRELATKQNLKGIIIDTISGMGDGIRDQLINDSDFDMMSRDLWGKYAVRVGRVFRIVRDLPTHIIINCHMDVYEDDKLGDTTYYPAIKGGGKTDNLRWLDVIIYNHVGEHEGKEEYRWQVKKDAEHPFIRTRVPVPEWEEEKFVEPDFAPIIRAYDAIGQNAKIMVVGHSGTGKTTALRTLANAKPGKD